MTKKKWILLVVFILLVFSYRSLFYKSFSEKYVSKNADCIIAVDVKRITNTIIWNFITTPASWNKISYSSSDEISWRDMIKIPDYVFIFHTAGHPSSAWYVVCEIKQDKDFDAVAKRYGFQMHDQRDGLRRYFSTASGIDMIRFKNKVLFGNHAVADKTLMYGVATGIFIQKEHIERERLNKNIEVGSHLSIQVSKNYFFEENAVIAVNFDKNEIAADGLLKLKKQFSLSENNFSIPAQVLFAGRVTKGMVPFYNLISDSGKSRISKALNFNIDSVFLRSNQYYCLDVAGIQTRVDSAISYAYDDNFNPVQKIVVNNLLEPEFNFAIHGDSVLNIYHYWNRNGQLENTALGELFLPMPFVKSYCSFNNKKDLSIASGGYTEPDAVYQLKCIVFLKLLFTKAPNTLINYLPSRIAGVISNIQSLELIAQNRDGQLKLHVRIATKNYALRLLNW